MTLWVTPEGKHVQLPAEFAGVRFRKDGWPDKRDPRYAALMAWVATIEPEFVVEGADAPEVVGTVEAFLAPLDGPRTLEPVGPNPFAQAFAQKVWDAQTPTEPRTWRLERVALAMANKGFSMEGIVL